MAAITPRQFLMNQLEQQTLSTLKKENAIFNVMIGDRIQPVRIQKLDIKETIHPVTQQLQAIADLVMAGMHQVQGTLATGEHEIVIDLESHSITVNGNTILIDNKLKSKMLDRQSEEIASIGGDQTKGTSKQRRAEGAALQPPEVETVKIQLTRQKEVLQLSLHELAEAFTAATHDRQEEAENRRRQQIEERIKELHTQLARVQEELDHFDTVSEVSKEKLTSLLSSIEIGIERLNYEAFYGRASPTSRQIKS